MQHKPEIASLDFVKGEALLFNKPYKWSSFQVVNKIRHLLRRRAGIQRIKVGHAGTLDPLATGLLIICTGKHTKRIEEFQGLEKEYTGTFFLGATTPSFDLETEINAEFPIDHVTEEQIIQTSKEFIGTFEQTPPVFSAVRIGGKRAYNFARNNEDVTIKPKIISVSEFEITKINIPEIEFKVVCSKGTYIRSLAHDFGRSLQSGAYLKLLRRTRIGPFHVDQAFELEEFEKQLILSSEGQKA